MNYDFDITQYQNNSPNYKKYFEIDSIKVITNCFKDNDSLNYRAPIIDGNITISDFFKQNIIYSPIEKDNGISGTVYIIFSYFDNGSVNQVFILRGIRGGNGLNKESLRVLKKLKFSKLPTLNGKITNMHLVVPIKFELY